ncbi:hypothetical protein ACFQ4Z_02710 [Oceanobacillus oncorhynchi subsp. oncorhynchi]|uniref:hypothetical protein n=1 Tax=Oceanobacillus oncorhynchi TaxID=545501 RepID=UPI003641594B
MKHYEAYDGTDLIAEGTAKAIQSKLGISRNTFYKLQRKGKSGDDEGLNVIQSDLIPEYAVYKGDEFLFIDTRENIIKKLKINMDSFVFYMSPANAKRDGGERLVIVNLDKEVD